MDSSDITSCARFAFRCAASAMLAYTLAVLFRLDHPVWAPVWALVVAKSNAVYMKESSVGRFIGTILGAVVAAMAYEIGSGFGWSPTLEIGVAVAIASIAAKLRPSIRVCMWTCVVVLLTTSSDTSVQTTAFNRSCEVMLGITISVALHALSEQVGVWLRQCQLNFRSRKNRLHSHL